MPVRQEVEAAAQTLATIRMMLETVSTELLEGVLKVAVDEKSRYMALGPILDPTDFQRNGREKELSLETQAKAARAFLELKKIWRQDIPLADRIQEALDAGAVEPE